MSNPWVKLCFMSCGTLVRQEPNTSRTGASGSIVRMRTRNGDHEIDFIIERDDHKIVALEVKLNATVNDSDVAYLHWLRNHLGSDILDTVVITTGTYAYRRGDGIAVIPAA